MTTHTATTPTVDLEADVIDAISELGFLPNDNDADFAPAWIRKGRYAARYWALAPTTTGLLIAIRDDAADDRYIVEIMTAHNGVHVADHLSFNRTDIGIKLMVATLAGAVQL